MLFDLIDPSRLRCIAFFCVLAAACTNHSTVRPADVVPIPANTSRAFDILQYTATVEPDLATGTVRGVVEIRLRIDAPDTKEIVLDRDRLQIDAVEEGASARSFDLSAGRLRIQLPPGDAGERTLRIAYHGKPRYGMQTHADAKQIYTVFSTSQWLPVVDAPDERARLDLQLTLPANLAVVANGRLLSQEAYGEGVQLTHWRLDHEVPSYVYGFAIGPFTEVGIEGHPRLRFLGSGFSEAELNQVFADTADMLRYFADRAGVPYPGETYTQALVVDTIGQELAGFSLLSEEYGRAVLADPTAETLIAHEAAHQWWGNGLTCKDWRHFWLNEGFATFLAATWMQQRFGDAHFQKMVSNWEKRVEVLRANRSDRPLVFPDWDHPTADDRAVVYQKGALALQRLRELLGEDTFWEGLRAYTRRHFGQAVVTRDFQRAMEASSGRDLGGFFGEWVDPVAR
jgi:aminopeptidase N